MNIWPYFAFCMTLPQLLLDTFMIPTTYPDCMVQWPKCHAGCAPAAGKVPEHQGMRRKTEQDGEYHRIELCSTTGKTCFEQFPPFGCAQKFSNCILHLEDGVNKPLDMGGQTPGRSVL